VDSRRCCCHRAKHNLLVEDLDFGVSLFSVFLSLVGTSSTTSVVTNTNTLLGVTMNSGHVSGGINPCIPLPWK
jgi:hypothetical protein